MLLLCHCVESLSVSVTVISTGSINIAKDMDFLNMQTKGRNDNKERNVRKQMNNDNDKRKMHSKDKIRTK